MFRERSSFRGVVTTHKILMALVASLMVSFGSGCAQPQRSSVRHYDRGLIWMFPGIESGEANLRGVQERFRVAGIESAIETYTWPGDRRGLHNLTEYERNREQAGEIATRIASYSVLFPERPIDLVGYSGGGGMALMVAEALPDTVHIRHIILVQAAISPDYELTSALSRVDGRIVNFYAPTDWLVLGLGTSTFGTMDRKKCESAGKNGFDVKLAIPDATKRDRLVQHSWTPEMIASGHTGGHLDIVEPRWNQRYVAPYLATPYSERLATVDGEQAERAILASDNGN